MSVYLLANVSPRSSQQTNAHILLIFYVYKYVYAYVSVYVRCLQDVCVDVYVLSGRLHVAFLQTVIYMLLKPEHRHGKIHVILIFT